MDHVQWSKHRGLKGCFQPKNQVPALLSRSSQLIVDAFPSGIRAGKAARSFRKGNLLEESLPVVTFGVVSVLESEPTLFSSLSPEENEDKASGEGFLEAEEAETLLEECLAMRQV